VSNFAHNFFSSRKGYHGVIEKVVGLITRYIMSGQRVLNSFPTWSYGKQEKIPLFSKIHILRFFLQLI
jgi:hypothetical protein